jgi:hypothetical protein
VPVLDKLILDKRVLGELDFCEGCIVLITTKTLKTPDYSSIRHKAMVCKQLVKFSPTSLLTVKKPNNRFDLNTEIGQFPATLNKCDFFF